MNIESVVSPPDESSGQGIAAVLRLITDPTNSIINEDVSVNVTVSGGTATGKQQLIVSN